MKTKVQREKAKNQGGNLIQRGMQDVFLYAQKPFNLVWQEPTHIPQLKNDSPL